MISYEICSALLFPKDGEEDDLCEDAISLASDIESRELRIIVADGASSGSFSGLWAQLVAASFVDRAFTDANDLQRRIPLLGVAWSNNVFCRDLPWHALERAQRGAFTTYVGLAISTTGQWRATAVGDSCMFQIRDDEILACFPLSHVQDFNNHPLLIASDPLKNERLADMFREASGGAVAGDVFLLATDAFSEFVIGQCYDKRILRSLLLSLSRQATAQMIIDQNRKQDLLHNDDVAIVVVRVS